MDILNFLRSPTVVLGFLGLLPLDKITVPTRTNVSYGSVPGQLADFYYPANSTITITRVIILLHGGSFGQGSFSGRKEYMVGLIPFLRATFPSLLIVNMDLRLGSMSSPAIPKQIQDISELLQFIRGLEPSPKLTFALFGYSSGAHLALLYGYRWDRQRKDVSVVIALLGATDFAAILYSGNPIYTVYLTALLGPVPNLEELAAVSPVNWVTPGCAKTLGFYGESDIFVPASQGRSLKTKLDLAGVENEFEFFQGGHFPLTDEVRRVIERKIVAFLRKYF